MSAGYLGLIGIFAAMVAGCFAFALAELRRPQDPGPLPIDVSRDIQHRHFAKLLRRLPAADVYGADDLPLAPHTPQMIYNAPYGPDAYLIASDGDVLESETVDAFVSDGVATIGPGATVLGSADGAKGLVVCSGARVDDRATSEAWVRLDMESQVRTAAAPHIVTGAHAFVDEPAWVDSWDESLDVDVEWMLAQGMPFDQVIRSCERIHGRPVSGIGALRRLEARTDVGASLTALSEALKPSWLPAGAEGWYLGAATVRVRGDLSLPAGAVVPFHLIVEGSLATGRKVAFHGGVHVWGDADLGAEARVEGSLTVRRALRMADRVIVGECVSAGGDVVGGRGLWVGGDRSGGLATTGAAALGPGSVIRHKLYAEQGARVRSLDRFVASGS